MAKHGSENNIIGRCIRQIIVHGISRFPVVGLHFCYSPENGKTSLEIKKSVISDRLEKSFFFEVFDGMSDTVFIIS